MQERLAVGWASFGQGELVKGRVMFPRRKVVVWAYREGFLDEVRLESYWMAGWKRSLAWVREEKRLGPPWAVECPAPERVSQNSLKTDQQGQDYLGTVCLEERVTWDSSYPSFKKKKRALFFADSTTCTFM